MRDFEPDRELVQAYQCTCHVIGRNLVKYLEQDSGWDIIGLSRRAPDFETRAKFISVDLLDRADADAKLSSITDATHIFYAAFQARPTWVEHNERQALGGLGHLDGLAEQAGRDGWLAGTARMSQADITGAVAYSFTRVIRPALQIEDRLPHLARFAERCEALDAFRKAPLPDQAG